MRINWINHVKSLAVFRKFGKIIFRPNQKGDRRIWREIVRREVGTREEVEGMVNSSDFGWNRTGKILVLHFKYLESF